MKLFSAQSDYGDFLRGNISLTNSEFPKKNNFLLKVLLFVRTEIIFYSLEMDIEIEKVSLEL